MPACVVQIMGGKGKGGCLTVGGCWGWGGGGGGGGGNGEKVGHCSVFRTREEGIRPEEVRHLVVLSQAT